LIMIKRDSFWAAEILHSFAVLSCRQTTLLHVMHADVICAHKPDDIVCVIRLCSVQESVSTMLQEEPDAAALVGATARMLRAADGTSKHALLHSDTAFQIDPAAAASCVARLKEREAAASTAVAAANSTAAHASAPLGAPAASACIAPPNMAEAQLEVLRSQQRLSVENAAMRLLGTLIGAVDTTRYMIFAVLAILGQLQRYTPMRTLHVCACAPCMRLGSTHMHRIDLSHSRSFKTG
jgi:hypothetical protein